MMKKHTYVYSLIFKVKKHPELLLKYGFKYYESEDKDISVFAVPIILKEDNPLFIQCVRFLEKAYEDASTEERKKDFKGYKFNLELQENQQNAWRLVMTDEIRSEFSQAQLCVSINKSAKDKTVLFVNSPIQNSYYYYETVEKCAPELIHRLLKDKIIFKKRHKY